MEWILNYDVELWIKECSHNKKRRKIFTQWTRPVKNIGLGLNIEYLHKKTVLNFSLVTLYECKKKGTLQKNKSIIIKDY